MHHTRKMTSADVRDQAEVPHNNLKAVAAGARKVDIVQVIIIFQLDHSEEDFELPCPPSSSLEKSLPELTTLSFSMAIINTCQISMLRVCVYLCKLP